MEALTNEKEQLGAVLGLEGAHGAPSCAQGVLLFSVLGARSEPHIQGHTAASCWHQALLEGQI